MSRFLKIVVGLVVAGILFVSVTLFSAYMNSAEPIRYAERFSEILIEGSYSEYMFCAGLPDARAATEEAMRRLILQVGKPVSYSAVSLYRIHLSETGRQYLVQIPAHFENFEGQLQVAVAYKADRPCIAGWSFVDVKPRSTSTVKS